MVVAVELTCNNIWGWVWWRSGGRGVSECEVGEVSSVSIASFRTARAAQQTATENVQPVHTGAQSREQMLKASGY